MTHLFVSLTLIDPRRMIDACGKVFLLAALAALAGCARPPGLSAPAAGRTSWIDKTKLVDLTHTFDASTLYWPTNQPFRLTRAAWGMTPGGWWYASNDYSASEHGGTHTDAPIHFNEGGWTLERVPLDRLIGPAVVVDVSGSCKDDPDYAASEEDIRAAERTNGSFPEGCVVLLRTGWGSFWPDRARYLGSAAPGDASNLHFPGFSEGAARYLAGSGKVVGVGLDTASMDPGNSKDFMTHRILSAANIYGLENLAELERLPAKGATLIALPMKIGGGTGGPTRVIAILPN